MPSWTNASSPRTRGCSQLVLLRRVEHLVVPAHAGVFPTSSSTRRSSAWSSPRTRGCSPDTGNTRHHEGVVPAHARVFLENRNVRPPALSRPRARGGVPAMDDLTPVKSRLSPRTRGCSRRRCPGVHSRRVVPAHAGVFRSPIPQTPPRPSRPRAHGSVPLLVLVVGCDLCVCR